MATVQEVLMKAAVIVVVIALLCGVSAVEGAPVRVRLPEGNVRGFLVLRSLAGEALAYGELRQEPKDAIIESRLGLTFKDGSFREETVAFTQKDVFRLEGYRLVQRGPSLPKTEVSFDRKSGQYKAAIQEKKDEEEKTASGRLEMPADLYNGMALVLLKNLPPGAGVTVEWVAFTPKPRLVKMVLTVEGEDRVFLGGDAKKVVRYLVKLELGGLTSVIASLMGKEPPDLRYWLVAGEVPGFVRFEGAMFPGGPVWRLEQTTVEWPK